jgi:hypothetical protein
MSILENDTTQLDGEVLVDWRKLLPVFSIEMKIEVTCSSEILELMYQTIWQYIPENYYLNTSCHESIKLHVFKVV